MQYPISMVFFDVVNVCNLSCPFCSTDWDKIKKGIVAKDDVIAKVLQLAPYVPEESCLSLSCAHEATLHPRLPEILDGLPDQHRRKFFMTSNMSGKMSDKLIESIAKSGMGHVSISCDSLDENTFSHLRRDGKLSVFLDNVERLSTAIREAGPDRAPKIRMITMGFKSNLPEVPRLVEYGQSKGAYWHEIRYLFDVPHLSDEFKRKELLSAQEWKWLEKYAARQTGVHVYMPPEGYQYYFETSGAEKGAARAIGLSTARHFSTAVASGDAATDAPTEPPSLPATDQDEIQLPDGNDFGEFREMIAARSSDKSTPTSTPASSLFETVNGDIKPFPPLTPPLTLHVGPDGSTVIGGWAKEVFKINILSIHDPGLFFSSLVSGFVPSPMPAQLAADGAALPRRVPSNSENMVFGGFKYTDIKAAQKRVNDYWESRSWRYTRWMRNYARRLKGLPRETWPVIENLSDANKIVSEIVHSTCWELSGPLRVGATLTRKVRRLAGIDRISRSRARSA